MRILACVVFALCLTPISAQTAAQEASADTDRDGLTDAVENALLGQFAPQFLVSGDDCSQRPAQFVPFVQQPQVEKENGAIYGQAFPWQGHEGQVELHFFHLWRTDCGRMSHPLDAEHVSALVVRDVGLQWKALYWYAAAHEDTLCNASQITRAAAVDGELRGPLVWISRGKHGSFLSAAICSHGCGGDLCTAMMPLSSSAVINLGERSEAMNGATWTGSAEWPLADKMSRSDFTEAHIAQVERLPAASIAWAEPGTRGMKSTIRVADSVRGSTAGGLNATSSALDAADSSTSNALDSASASTGRSLAKSASNVKKALRATAKKLGITE
jgi:hypothetical protein